MTVDNGAHILVGAYRETLRLMQKVGAGETALRREPLHLEFPGHVKVAAPQLARPAPSRLGAAHGARPVVGRKSSPPSVSCARQQAAASACRADITAADLLAAHRQPERVRRFLWEPLCLAALNTPVASASAQVFLNVLRDSLAADRAASDLLLPATDFSSLFPEPAARYIEAHGGKVHRSTRIGALDELATFNNFDHTVLAVAPYHLPPLVPEVAMRCSSTGSRSPRCYLAYPATARLPFPMIGLDTTAGGHGQWMFDRGALCGQHGLLAVVISGDGPWQALGHDALASVDPRANRRAAARPAARRARPGSSRKSAPPSPARRICIAHARQQAFRMSGWPATMWRAITRPRSKAQCAAASAAAQAILRQLPSTAPAPAPH